MSQQIRIALYFHEAAHYIREIVRGISLFPGHGGDWLIRRFDPSEDQVREIRQWRANGIITHVSVKTFATPLLRLKIPIVDVGEMWSSPTIARIKTDDHQISEMVFKHFINRGFDHLAYVGLDRYSFSRSRQNAFEHLAQLTGRECQTHNIKKHLLGHPDPLKNKHEEKQLRDWLSHLPRPVGIMACNDNVAMKLAETCRQEGWHVPEMYALVGVDNDPLVCDLSSPPLSSVTLPLLKIGFEASALMDQLLAGQPIPDEPLMLKPTGINTRQSSDILAVSNPHLADALRFIRDNAHRPIYVPDVLKVVSVNRRTLERLFARMLGRTPLQEIHRLRIERAKDLLINTELPVEMIAMRCGFTQLRRLSETFRSITGMSPTTFRRQYQLRLEA